MMTACTTFASTCKIQFCKPMTSENLYEKRFCAFSKESKGRVLSELVLPMNELINYLSMRGTNAV